MLRSHENETVENLLDTDAILLWKWKGGGCQSFCSDHLRMPEALTAWAVMQALMNIDVTIEAEVLFAFGANNRKTGLVSCTKASRAERM